MKLFKRLFCKHKDRVCLTNLYGDWINFCNCRSFWECKQCGKIIKSKKLDDNCEYVNFRKKEGK